MSESALRLASTESEATVRVSAERDDLAERIEALAARWGVDVRFVDQLRELLELPHDRGDTWIDGDEGGPSAHATVWAPEGPASSSPESLPDPQRRYVDLGQIGLGGMGEVRRVRDRRLGRIVAMKIIRPEYKAHPRALSRFLEEAQVSAQLAHPAIVPVHDLGRLEDGRVYFTMNEVEGRTLAQVLRGLHRASRGPSWGTTPDGWTLRRVLEAFRRVCDAVAYAHARGVLHRDLKPENIMLGGYGEVLVMDWGLARLHDDLDESTLEPVTLTDDTPGRTQVGSVAGTPAYMSPEQARGQIDQLGPASDVYALGALLYEILDGDAPYPGRDALERVLAGPPRPLGPHAVGRRVHPGPPIPDELRQLCAEAMARAPEHRLTGAAVLGDRLADWLDGARKRERALERVRRADETAAEVAALRGRARSLRDEAAQALVDLPPGADAEDKRHAWSLQDEAEALELDAELRNVEVIQHLRAALGEAPDTREAHERLAAHYQERHASARARRDTRGEAALEALIRAHDTGTWTAYLAGEATLSLATLPPVPARLLRAVEEGRRLVDVEVQDLGTTPLRRQTLRHGSYVVALDLDGGGTVRLPVHVDREQAWRLVPPGASSPAVLHLPDHLDEDECHVAPGWAWLGGDRQAPAALPRQQVWLDAFVCQRDPVTHRAYVTFLDALIDAEGLDAALRHAPRLGGLPTTGEDGLRYQLVDGRLRLGPDLDPDGPVTHVDHASATAYAAWLADRTGLPWRLPGELEWEKAARGVDGRFFPWGDWFDPSFCRVRAVHRTARSPDPVHAWPVDLSPYGVRGMAGNCRDWCAERYREEGPEIVDGCVVDGEEPWGDARSVRGGSWARDPRAARVAARDWETPESRAPDLGFRLVRTVTTPDP